MRWDLLSRDRRLAWILLLCFFLLSCGKGSVPDDPSSGDPEGKGNTEITDPSNQTLDLVSNGDFETDVNLQLSDRPGEGEWRWMGGWDAKGTNGKAAEVLQDRTRGINGSRCLVIIASETNVDVGFSQVIRGLTPGRAYKATARVRTESVEGGAGAHLSLGYLWAPRSNPITGTSDSWKTTVLEFEPTADTVVLCLKLGNTAADARGVAYFDNVSITYNKDLYERTSPGNHIRLLINKNCVSVSESVIDTWLGNLDEVYESYSVLFKGKNPYEGKTITIRSGSINAWAFAGNPIQWNKDYISDALLKVAQGDWCFGIMHELGHDYHPGHFPEYKGATNAWNFNEELFANFRMYYALCNVPGAQIIQNAQIFSPDGSFQSVTKTYKGKEIVKLYQSETSNSYDQTIAKNKAVEMGNALCYCMCRIVDKYGWDIWSDAFEFLYSVPSTQIPSWTWTQWDKFCYLLDALNKFVPAGGNVYDTFTANELNVIKKYLSTQK